MPIPNIAEAQAVQQKIHKAGVRDVTLMYDPTITPKHGPQGMWAVVQSFKMPSTILTMDNQNMTKTESTIMFWCKNAKDGTYRPPSDQDVGDVLSIVQRAQVTFRKGGDWLINQAEKREAERKEELDHRHHERIRKNMQELKKILYKEYR